jgi:hypothetical protein
MHARSSSTSHRFGTLALTVIALAPACTRVDDDAAQRAPRAQPAPIPAQPAYAPRQTAPAPAPPPPPAPAPPTGPRWPHAMACGSWAYRGDHKDPLPAHGVALHVWSMGGESVTTVDRDAHKLTSWFTPSGPAHPRKITRKLTDAQVDLLALLGDAAGNEVAHGEPPQATDLRQDLYYVDGADCFVVSNSIFDEVWRPTAGRLARAVDKLAGDP